MTKHDEIYLKRELNEWWCSMIEEEKCMKWDSIFNKKDEILFIDLINFLVNNEDSLLLNLLINLIFKQFTKIFYRDSHN